MGAGPAGLTTAFHLAKAGISCTVLDKDQSPKTKPCADILTGISLRELQKVFPDFITASNVSHKLLNSKGVIIHTTNFHHFRIDYKPEETNNNLPLCYGLKRADLDEFLVSKARENDKITLIENFEVREYTRQNNQITLWDKSGKQSVTTPLIIVAMGSNASLAYKLTNEKKDLKHYAVGVRGYFKGVNMPQTDCCELFFRKNIMPGLLYIAPFYDDVMNVNMAVRADLAKKHNINLKKLFFEVINEDPDLKKRFQDAEMIGSLQGSGLKLGTKTRPVSGDNFILTGDSAGLIDILSANGLPQAFISGRMAAEFAIKAIEQNNYSANFLKQFDTELFQAVDKYLKNGRLAAPYMGSALYQKMTMWIMNLFAKYVQNSDVLRDMLYYNTGAKHKLLNPSFYFDMFFRSKNPEHSS